MHMISRKLLLQKAAPRNDETLEILCTHFVKECKRYLWSFVKTVRKILWKQQQLYIRQSRIVSTWEHERNTWRWSELEREKSYNKLWIINMQSILNTCKQPLRLACQSSATYSAGMNVSWNKMKLPQIDSEQQSWHTSRSRCDSISIFLLCCLKSATLPW